MAFAASWTCPASASTIACTGPGCWRTTWAQGVNAASVAAFLLGDLIEEDGFFDERFCRKLESRLWAYLEDVTAWSVSVLLPPPPYVQELMGAAATCQPLADRIVSNYGHPHRAWDDTCSPERAAALVSRFTSAMG